ncbi:hypothetical protein Tco_1083493 [Tanacetum coccineum]
MQTQESKIDLGKALDPSLVVMENSGTKSGKQDTSSRSGNDANANDANIKPVYDKEPMVEVQLTAECNVTATGQQHTEQPEIINEGKSFDSCTSKVDSKPSHSSNVDITKIHKCKQTLDLSAGTLINVQKKESIDLSAASLHNVNKSFYSKYNSHDVNDRVGSLFGPLFDKYFNGENQVVSKSSAITTANASDKRQQQRDSTSSTSTLATTVTPDGNFNL